MNKIQPPCIAVFYDARVGDTWVPRITLVWYLQQFLDNVPEEDYRLVDATVVLSASSYNEVREHPDYVDLFDNGEK